MSDATVYTTESGSRGHRVVPPVQTPPAALAAMFRVHAATARQACNCESLDCHHAYMAARAGKSKADYVGPVCDECAATHMAPYLI